MPFLTVSSSPTLEKVGRARDRPRYRGIPWTGGLSLSNPWTGGLSVVYTGFSSHISTHLPPDRTPSSTLSPCLATQTPKSMDRGTFSFSFSIPTVQNPWTGGLSPTFPACPTPRPRPPHPLTHPYTPLNIINTIPKPIPIDPHHVHTHTGPHRPFRRFDPGEF